MYVLLYVIQKVILLCLCREGKNRVWAFSERSNLQVSKPLHRYFLTSRYRSVHLGYNHQVQQLWLCPIPSFFQHPFYNVKNHVYDTARWKNYQQQFINVYNSPLVLDSFPFNNLFFLFRCQLQFFIYQLPYIVHILLEYFVHKICFPAVVKVVFQTLNLLLKVVNLFVDGI